MHSKVNMIENVEGVILMADITFEQGVSEMTLTGFACCEMGDSLPGELFVANSLFSSYLTTLPYEEEASAFLRHKIINLQT